MPSLAHKLISQLKPAIGVGKRSTGMKFKCIFKPKAEDIDQTGTVTNIITF